ncbi:FMN-binding protein [Curtobacterium sp. 458]|uniref:FMN-binding protein n=1 Tax=Curtobacterium sp. 458 TaxID=3050069 RepID=UPI0025B370A8|nr:FMN-binding protein [Curtobacterium sp. 458]WJX99465.1 FMN-binding protein [Curtobacterium sp. 458]
MRARVVAGGIVTSAAVLVIGWQVGAQPGLTATQQQTSTSGGTSAGGTGSAGTGTAGTGSGTSGGASASAAAKDGTFTGQAAQTQYGPVQVEITVAGGKITDVTALELTDRDGRSAQISQQAAPILRQEALQAQSAQIQAVSGATYTSAGYVTSLQSAIDQAGL